MSPPALPKDMRNKEIQDKQNTELYALLAEKRMRVRELRFSNSSGKAKNVKEINAMRKDIARILTVFSARSKQQA